MTTATTPGAKPGLDHLYWAKRSFEYNDNERAQALALVDIAESLRVIAEALK